MLRKQIIKAPQAAPVPMAGWIEISAVSTVLVTSEAPEHPVDYAFDDRRGPGGSCWVAGEPPPVLSLLGVQLIEPDPSVHVLNGKRTLSRCPPTSRLLTPVQKGWLQ